MTPMVDPQRQECITNPSAIFEKQRMKSQQQGPIKHEGERQRETLKPTVPRIEDDDIIELCKRYPKQSHEDDTTKKNNLEKKKGAQLQMYKLQLDAKKKQFELVKNIEKSLKRWSKDQFKFNFQQLMNDFKDIEFMRNQKLLDEVNFADRESLKQLYLYVLNTELTGLLEADHAAAEYHNGKFDPSMLKFADPKKLKKKEPAKKKIPL